MRTIQYITLHNAYSSKNTHLWHALVCTFSMPGTRAQTIAARKMRWFFIVSLWLDVVRVLKSNYHAVVYLYIYTVEIQNIAYVHAYHPHGIIYETASNEGATSARSCTRTLDGDPAARMRARAAARVTAPCVRASVRARCVRVID